MKRIGAHVDTAGGLFNAPVHAKEIGATAFALFTKNPRQWNASFLTRDAIDAFKKSLKDNGYDPRYVVPHEGYLINMGNGDDAKRQKAYDSFLIELQRCEALGLPLLNIHPGAHPGETDHAPCLGRIADCVNRGIAATPSVTVVLETTAGQGTSVGFSFEQLASMIDMIGDKKRVGICLDTCHIFAAGYDIRTKKAYQETMRKFDDIIGLKYLKALHINDSKGELGSHLDRHDSLGKGNIGLDAFKYIMTDDRLDEIPMILETIDPSIWKQEIELLRSFAGKKQ